MIARRILVIGSGGREHALAWRLTRDPEETEVLVAPGNDGMARDFRRVDVDPGDANAVARACRDAEVDLVIVGPEAPLAAGLVDALAVRDVPAYGPSHAAARLEASKAFAKEVLHAAGVSTARSESHIRPETAREALDRFDPPWVIKADGLAAGKGVCVTADRPEAIAFLDACLVDGRFGEAGRRVLIEDFLEGEEASVMAVCDGLEFVLLPAARDHKRARDDDRGPNTGGMGAWAPAPRVDAALERTIGETIVRPVLAAMRTLGARFQGTLYCGLMLGASGPSVVEFNVRFGDPETQVILPLLEGDLGGLLGSAMLGSLEPQLVRRRADAAVAVALVSDGYPDDPRGGGVIEGLDALGDEVTVFHAATRSAGHDRWEITGGRAAYITAMAGDVVAARERAYAAIARLGGGGWRYRRDIAAAAVPSAPAGPVGTGAGGKP